jgi:hypothetical protein
MQRMSAEVKEEGRKHFSEKGGDPPSYVSDVNC